MKPLFLTKNQNYSVLIYVNFLILLSFLNGGVISAQDIHFSQFYATPYLINPANTGNYVGDWRFSNGFRSQWNSIAEPFNTLSVGIDRQFYSSKQNFSAGLYIINDKSGILGFTTNKGYFSLAYHKYFKNTLFHFGIQPGFVNMSYNLDNITLPSNYNPSSGEYESGYGANTQLLADKSSYFDLNTGIILSRKFGNVLPSLGASFFHVNNPKETFITSSSPQAIGIRQSYTLDFAIDLNEHLKFSPRILNLRQRKAMEQLWGANLENKLAGNKYRIQSIFAGMYIRNQFVSKADAIIIVGGLTIRNWSVGLNYDFNVSGLRKASNFKGAFEISIIYKAVSTFFDKFTIPCDRL